VDVVAIRALNESFVYLVMERHVECRLGIGVALEAKRWLGSLQELGLVFTLVNAVTTGAADIGFRMGRALEIRMGAGVATKAFGVDILGRGLGGIEDFGDIAATGDMLTAGAVAVLAGDAGTAMHERHLGVRIGGEPLAHVFMAGSAGVGAYEISMGGCLGRRVGAFGRLGWRGQRSCAQQACAQQKHRNLS